MHENISMKMRVVIATVVGIIGTLVFYLVHGMVWYSKLLGVTMYLPLVVLAAIVLPLVVALFVGYWLWPPNN
jgi:hypothetical protein